MANVCTSDEGVPDEQITLSVCVCGRAVYFESVKRGCLQLSTLKCIWWASVWEVTLFSVVLLPFLLFLCTDCVTLPPYRWCVSTGNSAFDQMALWSPHRDWTLDTKRAWVCVLAALLPSYLFCHLVCALHATDDFYTLIWWLIILVQSKYIWHFSVISTEMYVQISRVAIRYTYRRSRSISLSCMCFISPDYHRGCCGFMLRSSRRVLVLWWIRKLMRDSCTVKIEMNFLHSTLQLRKFYLAHFNG